MTTLFTWLTEMAPEGRALVYGQRPPSFDPARSAHAALMAPYGQEPRAQANAGAGNPPAAGPCPLLSGDAPDKGGQGLDLNEGQRLALERALAMQGHILTEAGHTISEVFILDLPEDLTIPGEGPLAGQQPFRELGPPGITAARQPRETPLRHPPRASVTAAARPRHQPVCSRQPPSLPGHPPESGRVNFTLPIAYYTDQRYYSP